MNPRCHERLQSLQLFLLWLGQRTLTVLFTQLLDSGSDLMIWSRPSYSLQACIVSDAFQVSWIFLELIWVRLLLVSSWFTLKFLIIKGWPNIDFIVLGITLVPCLGLSASICWLLVLGFLLFFGSMLSFLFLKSIDSIRVMSLRLLFKIGIFLGTDGLLLVQILNLRNCSLRNFLLL